MSITANNERATSPLASGPAGSHFEGQIGAFYLLSMLSSAPPRGLPGTTIERVALQQANTGRSLDDVIVHAHDLSGNKAVLEIQVKRTITFAPTDPIFRKVVSQIVKAAQREDFLTIRYELAIATTKGSRKVDGAYQDVLTLARQIGDATMFMAQINLAGAANDDMRTFVQTFRNHLQNEGLPDDDATAWQLLRRLQILTFDFTAIGSASEELARERSARILHEDDISRAGALWKNLIELAIDIAKSGGDRMRETLLQSLIPFGFRFAGDRRHAKARAALAEASRLALADIGNRVGNVLLSRQERIAAVYDALDHSCYVEIRGEAGVGKSGVLRLLAEQVSTEGQVIVLSPRRCVPRGWHAMKAQLDFDGTIRDLFVELVNDGGATLFIDNLEFFSEEERLTVIDIVREATSVPGISIIITARHRFGVDEPSWLPLDALNRLGQAVSVEINELSKAEIEQLKVGDPTLIALLANNHPAHQVTRNLFRLARLANQVTTAPWPRTEIDMAEQWWKTADGSEKGRRDRARLLQDAAEQTFHLMDIINVKNHDSEPIDALVKSGTFRDLGIDQVAFYHDVLREWTIANVFYANPNWIDQLNLERPIPAMLARGIELAARMAIERSTDSKTWHSLIERLSPIGAHQSWRRAALLALVRSEAKEAVLQRVSTELQENHALLLRELIRTVLAVEVVAASTAFSSVDIDSTLIPINLNISHGPAWVTLIIWLLSLGEEVPSAAIPEIVELYTTFSISTFGATAITPLTTHSIYKWLRMMEPYDAIFLPENDKQKFWYGLQREQIQSLKTDLRHGFIMFSKSTPELAAEYLNAIMKTENNNELVRNILKMRGTLAQAAPTELAQLTAQALIEKPHSHDDFYKSDYLQKAFTFLDHEFLPVSPAQGPFFELLVNSPKDGLALIHQLVDHAITHGSRGRTPGTNVITLRLSSVERNFPWTQTYFWSRNSNYYCVTSALMALEAWGHCRLDAGEAFETVLADVLGPVGSAAAYLLVAVDLIISHWPKSVEVATEFLGCPELLCIDHTRQVYDHSEIPDFFGINTVQVEPQGAVSLEKLKRRASRQTTLGGLIGRYILIASPQQKDKLVALLNDAAIRLGSFGTEANFGDPEFMVIHALNLTSLTNWPEVEVILKNGSTTTIRHYVSPVAEQQHLQALQDATAENTFDDSMETTISLAIEDPSHLSSEALLAVVTWARRAEKYPAPKSDNSDDDSNSQRMRQEAILTAAMIAIRDGDIALYAEHEKWAKSQLTEVLRTQDDDPAHQIRAGLRFNPTAIAYAGLIYALRHRNTTDDIRMLLEVVAYGNHAASHGFGASALVLESIDTRLPRALLRCAFTGCIVPNQEWDLPQEEITARAERCLQRAKDAVDAEIAWLIDGEPEPQWPSFPKERILRKRGIRLHGGVIADEEMPQTDTPPLTEHVNHQTTALWLRQTRDLLNVNQHLWLCELTKAYMTWTIIANGVEIDEVDRSPYEWNDIFFALVAQCLIGLSFDEIDKLILTPITNLPDRHFFDVIAVFQRSVDGVYFGGGDIQTSIAVNIRTALADRMMKSYKWKHLNGKKGMSIEMHIGPAIAVLFFNDHYIAQSTKCYLYAKGTERIGPFLPLLERMIQSASSPFIALMLLNLLEVAPHSDYLNILVVAGKAWLNVYPDFRPFWIDHCFGRRWCLIIENIRIQFPSTIDSNLPIRSELDSIIAMLISLGIPEASRLEETFGNL